MSQLRERVRAPSFLGLVPASIEASRRAATSSGKRDTRVEVLLRRYLYARGLRFRIDVADLPGRPDIVFMRSRVAVFVDGDFWHGRRLKARLARLSGGHNAGYWSQKILANRARDRRVNEALRRLGWRVARAWETDIQREVDRVGKKIVTLVQSRAGAAPGLET
jgi:DNA mismatch endonuclease, patch repair protein